MNWKSKFTYLLAVVALGTGLALSGCSKTETPTSGAGESAPGGAAPAAAAPDPATMAPAVTAARVRTVEQNFTREWPATLASTATVNVRARVAGTLENFTFKEGQGVQKGQVLFRIDDSPYVAALQQAQAQVAQCEANLSYAKAQVSVHQARADLNSARADLVRAQQDVDRYLPLAKNGVVPTQTLDNAIAQRDVAQAKVDAAVAVLRNTELSSASDIEVAQANLEAAQAAVTQAKLNIGYCTITSPLRGIIGKLDVSPGNLVGQAGNTQTLVTISALDPIYCNFSIAEGEYLYMMRHRDKGGANFELVLSDNTVYKYKGTFNMLSRTVDSKSGTIGMRIRFPNPDGLLREGQFGRLRLTSQTPERVLVVPQKAVSSVQSDHSVYVIGKDNIIESRNIVIGDGLGTDFIVKSGLKPGEAVVVDGLMKVQVGSPCRPTFSESPLAQAAEEEEVG